MTLSSKLRDRIDHTELPPDPVYPAQTGQAVWKGPVVDGVTYSLLSRWLVCRERFRLYALEGIRPAPTFNHKIHYGSMWHTCEHYNTELPGWRAALALYATSLVKQFPSQGEQIDHWYNVCSVQFPLYLDYWTNHPEQTTRQLLLQEHVFDVPYRLPTGVTVRLRGRWDAVDKLGAGKGAGIYLREHKTKGDIREEQIKRQLNFDLQTLMYLIALQKMQEAVRGGQIL